MGAAVAVLGVVTYRFLRRHSLFEIENVEPGQVIFSEGEEGDCAYFIHEGSSRWFGRKRSRKSDRAAYNRQYFGEMALISNAPRNATVRAVTPAKVAVLGKANFLALMKVMPATQQDIMKTVNERAMRHSSEVNEVNLAGRRNWEMKNHSAGILVAGLQYLGCYDASLRAQGRRHGGAGYFHQEMQDLPRCGWEWQSGSGKLLGVTFTPLSSDEVQKMSDDDIKKIITEGKDKMKPVKDLTDADKDNVIAYVRTLKK